ncbi:endonuclease [Aureococcus anophagefferens]|nr:endonuclease [Aureococcus anophagefferens]
MEAQKVDDEDLSVDARDWNLGVFAAERLAVDGAKRAATRRGAKRAVKEGDAAAPGRILAAMAAHGHAPELKAPAARGEATRDSYAAAAVAVLEQFARDDDGGEGPARRADSRRSSSGGVGRRAWRQRRRARRRPDGAHAAMMVCKRRAAQGTGDWPSIQLYNAVLEAYEAAGRGDAAIALLDQLQADGVPVDAVTYNICLRVCAKAGDLTKATSLLDEMSRRSARRARRLLLRRSSACCAPARGGRRRRHTRDDGEGTAAAALDVLDRCVAGVDRAVRSAPRSASRRPPDDDPPPFARAILGLDVLARMNRAGYRRSDLDSATLGRLAKAAVSAVHGPPRRPPPRARLRPPPAE